MSVAIGTVRPMRVSVLVDGYNLYYAGRRLCGRGTAGWRWLDIRGLAEGLVAEQAVQWPHAAVERVVYCTARVKGAFNLSGAIDQEVLPGGRPHRFSRRWRRTALVAHPESS